MKPLNPNTLLQNRYLIVQLIGKGGMGEVYLAVDQRLGSAIAIKRTYFTEDEMLGNAFEREARTLARLRHPVLTKVSDHFIENENQYLVMEHISGDDLGKRLENGKKPFPINWVLFWADQLLDALHYLHSHEPPIIHRDIKPQNLKLTDENHIILLDFGLAKDTVGQTKITTTGSVVGFTPYYAPMEQIRGTGTNARSDIYALSATLYQILTNVVPFDALSRADSLLNGVADPVQPINEINKEVSKQISDIILKGMSVSQEQRFSTAREMQKALRDAFAALQSVMAAQTIAFNAPDEKAALEPPPEPPDQFATLVDDSLADKQTAPPLTADESSSAAKTEVLNFADEQKISDENVPDFNATLKMDDLAQNFPEAKQSDIKTEIFVAPQTATETKAEADTTEKVEPTAPDVTVPLLNIDGQTSEPVSEFKTSDDLSPAENAAEQPEFVSTENYQPSDASAQTDDFSEAAAAQNFVQPAENYASGQTAPPPPAQKKSGGKALAVIGGLFALMILVIGVAGGGWYAYKNYVAVEQPTPLPEISPSIELTPEPTLAETNTDNSNSEIAETDNVNSGKYKHGFGQYEHCRNGNSATGGHG